MPAPKKDATKAPTPPLAATGVRTLNVGRKVYQVEGGVNTKGRYVRLAEKVGRRNSYVYIPPENVAEIVGMLTTTAQETLDLVTVRAAPEEVDPE